jgi:hypothetical protein
MCSPEALHSCPEIWELRGSAGITGRVRSRLRTCVAAALEMYAVSYRVDKLCGSAVVKHGHDPPDRWVAIRLTPLHGEGCRRAAVDETPASGMVAPTVAHGLDLGACTRSYLHAI